MTINFTKNEIDLREKLKDLERPSVDKLVTKDGNDVHLDTISGNTKFKSIDASFEHSNVVDVFVYDTSKDSDGGAWRKRTHNTSWYNETLNTSIRGSRREFPAVAVLVLEYNSRRLVIYDGDDPELPMWMVFNASSSNLVRAPFASSVAMLNAKMVVTDKNNYAGSTIDFLLDGRDSKRDLRQIGWAGNIADRNDSSKQRNFGSTLLANQTASNVAMAVLQNAPIDPATGLPIPTIAVATNAGATIIRDDGTVTNHTHQESSNTVYRSISLTSSGVIRYGARSYGSTPPGSFYVYSNDDLGNRSGRPDRLYTNRDNKVASDTYEHALIHKKNGYTIPFYGITNISNGEFAVGTAYYPSLGKGDNGFYRIIENINTSSNNIPIVANITTTFNTGWMFGECKISALADTVADRISSNDLISNGTFDSDVSGWSASTSGNGTTISHHTDGGGNTSLRVQSDTSTYGSAVTEVALESNTTYVLSYYLRYNGGTTAYYARTGYGTDPNASYYTNIHGDNSAAAGHYNSFTFTTGTITGTQYLKLASRNDGTDFRYDNITLRKAEIDRSAQNRGFQVFGTIIKQPVADNSDLVSYRGFSSTNLLVQQYHHDGELNPGTGNYSFMCWFKCSATSAEQIIMRRFGNPVTGGMMLRIVASSSVLQWYVRDTSSNATTIQSPNTVDDGSWHCAVGTRQGSTANLYLDGVLVNTQTCSANSHDPGTNAKFCIGAEEIVGSPGTFQNPANNCSLALIRYSLDAPNAEQVRKMYNDEKKLFNENVKCTIYGTADATNGLDYDESTGTLHVGTVDGRSDFHGLCRINNTTSPVTTALSASNGLIVEE